MTTSDPKVPTPADKSDDGVFWWRDIGGPFVVRIFVLGGVAYWGEVGRLRRVEDDGLWLAPCLSPSDHAALLAERDALRATVERVEALRDGLQRVADDSGATVCHHERGAVRHSVMRLTAILEDR